MGKWPYGTTVKPNETTTVATADAIGAQPSAAEGTSNRPDTGQPDPGPAATKAEPGANTAKSDSTIAGNVPTKPTADQPVTAQPGQSAESGGVLIGAQYADFTTDRDVIRIGNEIGKFDRVRLRVLDNDIHINDIKIVYADGVADTLAVNAGIPKNSRTNWIELRGDRFIREIQFTHGSMPDFKGQSRIEAHGQYAPGWISSGGEGGKYNEGWVMLGAQETSFAGFDKDVIAAGKNDGGFKRLRVTVRDRAVTVNELRVVYVDGTDEVIPIRTRIDAGATFGPIDLKSEKRLAIDYIEAKYRSRFFDASVQGKRAATTEIWAQR